MDVYAGGDGSYFAEIIGNNIFRYNLETDEITLFCTICEEDEYGHRLFGTMVIYEKDIFLLPFSAIGIYRINIQTRDYVMLDVPNGNVEEYQKTKFIDAHLYKGIIYAIPAAFPSILEIQCSSNRITVYDTWIKEIPIEYLNIDAAFFRRTICMDNKIYAPSCKGNIVMIFDLEKKECNAKTVGGKRCRFSDICYDNKNFWLSPRDNGPIVEWNESKNIWWEYEDFPKDYVAESSTGIEIWENQVMVFPQKSNMILAIDCADKTIKEWNKEYRGESVLWYGKCGETLLLCMDRTAEILILRKENIKSIKCAQPLLFQERYKKMVLASIKKEVEKGVALWESYREALEDYCQYMIHKEEVREDNDTKEEIGQQIYEKFAD